MTTTLEARKQASLIECVTKTAANRSSANSWISWSLSRSRVISSIAANGSSNRNRFGCSSSERAMETRDRMPPDSAFGYLDSLPVSPTSSSTSAARAARSCFGIPCSSANSSTLPCTVRQGSRVGSWKT